MMDINKFQELMNGSEFGKLPLETMAQLAKLFTFQRFTRGEHLYAPGDPSDWIGFIVAGSALVFTMPPHSQEEVWDLLCEGDYCFVTASYFENLPYACGIQALENIDLAVVHRKDLRTLYASNPHLHAFTYQLISNQMIERLDQRGRLLNMTALERYKFFMSEYPNLLSRVALGHVSSYLGIRQSSLSRIRKSLRESARSMAS